MTHASQLQPYHILQSTSPTLFSYQASCSRSCGLSEEEGIVLNPGMRQSLSDFSVESSGIMV